MLGTLKNRNTLYPLLYTTQEIVFIGLKSDMDEKKIREKLDDCLIKNYLKAPNTFHKIPDPFPAWFQKVA